ncbi:F-box/LRR-repeat protein [Striga hermonthica]|uniref:F-box/LRR-repeat protein n=1 Tax=Striga hermonthica TaxID=68872 RepID=A0A9N7RL51_STRHE|nr:F-box/LRR-repeat protein [Striga hermonthica]
MKKLKQAAETEETLSTAMADDRISNLPIHTLHRILCSLSQKEAVRTCLLSKQWRYIVSTRPDLEFFEYWFDNTQQNFVSVVSRTLQGYLDQNLSVHKLHLDLSRPMVSLLDKWMWIIAALGIKAFKLDIFSSTSVYYDLPSAVFLSDSLQELHLCNCRLSPVESVRFNSLHMLTLEEVQVDGRTFETKTLRCPLLRRLVIKRCWELRNVWLSEAPGLKHFELFDSERMEGRTIEIDVPNLETVSIRGPWIWSHQQSTFLFSRLTSLHLCNVILSSESIDMLSFGFPTLESLALDNCSGFEGLHLANDSVKRLSIATSKILLKGVTICAPNIVIFGFTAGIPHAPDTFSFTTTTSKEWYSQVFLSSSAEGPDFDANLWFLKLRRMLKTLKLPIESVHMQLLPRLWFASNTHVELRL